MSLVKWIRKNNRKIMVFVVIFCMVSFVIGYTGLQIIASIFNPKNRVIARYDDGQKIKNIDLNYAQNELIVLRMLMAERLLTSQGLSGSLLNHLLFPDSQISGDIAAQLKQAVQQGQLPIGLDELEAYFNQPTQRPEDLWILLKAEAYRAGFIVSNEQAKQILRAVIPQILQVDAISLIQQIISKHNLTGDQIVRTYGDLLTVVNYANTVMDNEMVTLNQIKNSVSRTKERLDAEFAKIDAVSLIDEQASVSDEDLRNQFETFKGVSMNNFTPDNPFGFGYKLPKRVQVEYMVVLMDDVKSQVETTTPEALEDYYRKNIERFQSQIPIDPNNPDSEKITRTRSFAEVEPQIRSAVENDKASRLANIMFNEIKDITESGFEEITFDEATVAQLQMAAGDYPAAAKKISDNYNVPLKVGKTGWLSAADLSQDEVLSRLILQQQQNRISLPDLLLAVTSDPKQVTRRIGMPNIRVWQNIGPVKGGYYSLEEEKYYPLMAMVRVIGIQDAAIPQTIDVEYDTEGVVLFGDSTQADTNFVLKEKVKEDLLLQKAMGTAKAHGEELAELAQSKGWDEAIETYNEKYAPGADPDDMEENSLAVKLDSVKGKTRASQTEIIRIKQYIQQRPAAAEYLQGGLVEDMLNNRLYEMLPEASESTGTVQKLLVFEPGAACYVVKNVTRQPATLTDYLDNKATTAMQLNGEDTVGLAMVHLNPKNILERMNYEPEIAVQTPQETPDETANEETEE